MGKGKGKQPKVGQAPPEPVKQPKFVSDPRVSGWPIVWRFSNGDRDGPFPWDAIHEAGALSEVIGRFANIETLTEAALRESGCHPVAVTDLCKSAQDRLTAIKQDDLDTLFSIRINGKTRVWAIHHVGVMRILWFDPEHLVCPSVKKHT